VVFTVTSDAANTQRNWGITADAKRDFVYRLYVDLDPKGRPLDLFNEAFIDNVGHPRNQLKSHPGRKFGSAPKC
jgi:hypothetical protein